MGSFEKLDAKIFFPDIVMLYSLVENQCIYVQKVLHFSVCGTFLKRYQAVKVVMCVQLLQWMSWYSCSWCRNELWLWFEYYVHSILSLQKYKLLLFAQTGITWACQNMLVIQKYRNLEKRKVTTRKILVLKSCRILDFHSEYYIP